MADGTNHVSSHAYNSKPQPTQFVISGSVVHQTYGYYKNEPVTGVRLAI
jgi:hypothetical protein